MVSIMVQVSAQKGAQNGVFMDTLRSSKCFISSKSISSNPDSDRQNI